MSEQDTEATVRKTVLLFNRTRVGEATAKLVSFSPTAVVIEFSGGFCYGCGVTDITEGFADQYKHLTSKTQLKETKTIQVNPRTIQTTYNIKNR
jgi:hypothetical protein